MRYELRSYVHRRAPLSFARNGFIVRNNGCM
jgi:hypothetical protein